MKSWVAPVGILIFIAGWVVGSIMMVDLWESSAKRGHFEVGHVAYLVKPLGGSECAQDIAGLIACTSGADK